MARIYLNKIDWPFAKRIQNANLLSLTKDVDWWLFGSVDGVQWRWDAFSDGISCEAVLDEAVTLKMGSYPKLRLIKFF